MAEHNDASCTEVILSDRPTMPKKKSEPKRVLHFSDGVLEEYNTDEEYDQPESSARTLVDPRNLTWVSYLWYLAWTAGSKTLTVCDYLGENLAYFFGITSPKYLYELEEYSRMLQEEANEEEMRKQDEEGGWKAERGQKVVAQCQPVVTTQRF